MTSETSRSFWQVRFRPTWTGGLWVLMCFACMLLAFHFNSNLALAFVFMLLSLWVVAPLFGYMNLMGVQGHVKSPGTVFCGQYLSIYVKTSRKVHSARVLSGDFQIDQQSNLEETESGHHLVIQPQKRGLAMLRNFKLVSEYPFGFFKFTRSLSLENAMEVVVYPEPKGVSVFPEYEDPKGKEDLSDQQDSSDVRDYSPGDPLSRIHWRQSAKGTGLITKLFDDGSSTEELLLTLPENQAYEQSISQLTLWVLEADRQLRGFTMKLPGGKPVKGQGNRHVAHCLRDLAFMPNQQGTEKT